jgi:hypothetical protein
LPPTATKEDLALGESSQHEYRLAAGEDEQGQETEMSWIKSEPAAIAGAVQAALGLLLAFGVRLSTEQVGAVMAVVAAVLALAVRQSVTPVAKPAAAPPPAP